jgi:uncharacterized protein YmfQ (DUF2313 family)
MQCSVCQKEILKEDLKFLLGIDIPYCNIWMHRSCYKRVLGEGLREYLTANIERILSENQTSKQVKR